MKTILCFGDSNTWGWNPEKSTESIPGRFAPDIRWTGVLQRSLGNSFSVIEEGLNSRTTVIDDPLNEYRNGKKYLIPCLHSHTPLDIVVIMLGSNDLKVRFSMTATDIAYGVEILVNIVRTSCLSLQNSIPNVLVLTPPPVGQLTPEDNLSWAGAQNKSMQVGEYLKMSSEKNSYHLLDTHTLITPDELSTDGVHLTESCHKKLGEAVAKKIQQMN
jgi:lysophospholipase L1-like esterase